MKKAAMPSILVAVVLLALGVIAEAQQPGKIPRIGYLIGQSRSTASVRIDPFRQGMRELGYVEGKNIVIEWGSSEQKVEALSALAAELVRLKVDIIVTAGPIPTRAAKEATSTIPIVMTQDSDPVGSGFVASLARPGGNITGFTNITALLVGKRLELLKETIPKLSRVAVLWDPQNPGSAQQWQESLLSARELGLQLHSIEVSSADKFESGIKEAAKVHSAALAVTGSALINSNQKRITDLAAKNRLPSIYPRTDFVDSGGLMSYGPDEAERFRRAAVFVDKILKGTKPADIPVEQPTKFELVINLKAAKQIGLTIPPNVLARTDKVIR
jgi:putative ABC transport system substrate-binding protein